VSSSRGACSFEHDGGHSTLVTEVQGQHAFAPLLNVKLCCLMDIIALKGEAVFG
jgi:hypothetical protein